MFKPRKQNTLYASIIIATSSLLSFNAKAELSPLSRLDADPLEAYCLLGGTFPDSCVSDIFIVTAGTWLNMSGQGSAAIEANNGIILGVPQLATGSHSGPPDGNENPDIDAPWEFFGSTGMSYTVDNGPSIISDDGAGNVVLDFSSWRVTWNGIPEINMSTGAHNIVADGTHSNINVTHTDGTFTNSQAIVTCENTCEDGDRFSLEYRATVPAGDPSNFGGVEYTYFITSGTITDLNEAPVCTGFTEPSIIAGSETVINIAANVSDTNNNYQSASAITITNSTACAAITDNNNGTITFPNCADGTYTFDYSVADALGKACAAATVSFTISNTAPTANDDTVQMLAGTSATIDVLANDSDADSTSQTANTIDPTTVTIVSAPTNGSTSIDATTGSITYTPSGSSNDSFTYTVQDTIGATSATATVTITVTATPAPSAVDDSGITTAKNTPVEIDVLSNDVQTDTNDALDPASVALVTSPNKGSISIATTGIITYTPATGEAGIDTFTYTVSDNGDNGGVHTSDPATVTIEISNNAPTANNVSLTTTVNTNITFNIADEANDDDGSIDLTSISVSNGSNGATSVSNGIVTYTPNTGFSGDDSFTYTVSDDNGTSSNEATVSVVVNVADIPATDSGSYTAGSTASAAGSTSGILTSGDISVVDEGNSDEQGVSQSCIGGCFDFSVSGLTNGATIKIVLPLTEAIPTPAEGNSLQYRKLDVASSTWRSFDSSGENAIHTAAGSGGTCPPADDTAYDSSPSLTSGHNCVRLSIVDGGPNDDDGDANGTVVDPGGIAEVFVIDTRVSGSDGCSMSNSNARAINHIDWLLIAGFITLLGVLRTRRKEQ